MQEQSEKNSLLWVLDLISPTTHEVLLSYYEPDDPVLYPVCCFSGKRLSELGQPTSALRSMVVQIRKQYEEHREENHEIWLQWR